MSQKTVFARRFLVRGVAAMMLTLGLAACGGGGDVSVGVGLTIPVQPVQPSVAPLTLALTRVGPADIALDWSDNPYVANFLVVRDDHALTTVTTTSLIDSSVLINGTYCYQVQGYDAAGQLVAASSTGCITVLP